ncbi:hypothetical protein HK439_06330 [Labrenzia aggregata]|uniref:Uncharacterized protein n=1 Tax=Roseibium aggregatum TaxID=187304 RepID=A0A926S5X8_9HYPH|nr:hypothetical protein [Roseibium aggregatum]MBD1545872.1 hypothetical protein [Roseibium aggregatum]
MLAEKPPFPDQLLDERHRLIALPHLIGQLLLLIQDRHEVCSAMGSDEACRSAALLLEFMDEPADHRRRPGQLRNGFGFGGGRIPVNKIGRREIGKPEHWQERNECNPGSNFKVKQESPHVGLGKVLKIGSDRAIYVNTLTIA